MNYESKYLKYKTKYLNLKNSIGGGKDFIEAVRKGDLKTVRTKLTVKHGLLKPHFADGNQVENKTEQTPLMIALNNMDIPMVNLLIEFQADVNYVYKQTKTNALEGLIEAIDNKFHELRQKGHNKETANNMVDKKLVQMLVILIDAGADVQLSFLNSHQKRTKFVESIQTVKDILEQYIRQTGDKYVSNRHVDRIELMLELMYN
jgi:ankyrin repeat protein